MKKVSIDYFEGCFARCEDSLGNMIDIKKSDIPKGAVEGDILKIFDNGTISIDKEETFCCRQKIFQLQNETFKNKGAKK